jgi:hypothetical protein
MAVGKDGTGASVSFMVKTITTLEKMYGNRSVDQSQWDRMVTLLGAVEQHWRTLEKVTK